MKKIVTPPLLLTITGEVKLCKAQRLMANGIVFRVKRFVCPGEGQQLAKQAGLWGRGSADPVPVRLEFMTRPAKGATCYHIRGRRGDAFFSGPTEHSYYCTYRPFGLWATRNLKLTPDPRKFYVRMVASK